MISVIYAACRQCYSAQFAGDIFNNNQVSLPAQQEFVRKVVASGHDSPLEHVKFTFAVEGVSRALTHQILLMAQEKLPWIFENAGAKCEELKYCPEGEKFSCGKYPVKNSV